MNYDKIKEKVIEIQEMMSEIPQECKGMSDDAKKERERYMAIKSMIADILEYLKIINL